MFHNKLLRAGKKFLINKDARLLYLSRVGLCNMTDEEWLKRKFKLKFGYELNLKNPQTFNEKLQWLKLYDRNPLYTTLVDKIEVKKYIADKIGQEYIIPTLGVWNDPDEIDFDSLPDQFVLKCNHDSGGLCICKDKSQLDINMVKRKLRKSLKNDFYLVGREWPYKNVKRRILAEKYMVDESGAELKDYKLMCFGGKVKCSFVCSERYSESGIKVTFFDNDWNILPFERHYPRSIEKIEKPRNYNKMVLIAEELSKDMPFVRVDFYEIKEKIYFGEMTFYPGCGFEEFSPDGWDQTLGDWIQLPQKNFL